MFKFESSPAFAKDHKVRELAPESAAKFDKERIRMLLHRVSVPEAVVFILDHDFAVHHCLSRVGRLTIRIYSCELIDIRLKYLRPGLSIIQMDSINSRLGRKGFHFLNQEFPSLDLTIVEHHGFLVLNSLSVGSVANAPLAIGIQIVKQEVPELTMMS